MRPIFAGLVTAGLVCVWLQTQAATVFYPGSRRPLPVWHPDLNNVVNSWAWTREEWTANDAPYRNTMTEIDFVARAHKDMAALASQYQAQAKSKPYQYPYSPTAQFRWAYATYLAGNNDARYINTSDYTKAWDSLGYCFAVHSYTYDRLHFLMMTTDATGPELTFIGDRLIRRDPHDYEVKYRYVTRLMNAHISNQEWHRALAYCQDLHTLRPSDPRYLLAYAAIYNGAKAATGDSQAQAEVIGYYQKFLNEAQPNDPNRRYAETQITLLKKLAAIYARHKMFAK